MPHTAETSKERMRTCENATRTPAHYSNKVHCPAAAAAGHGRPEQKPLCPSVVTNSRPTDDQYTKSRPKRVFCAPRQARAQRRSLPVRFRCSRRSTAAFCPPSTCTSQQPAQLPSARRRAEWSKSSSVEALEEPGLVPTSTAASTRPARSAAAARWRPRARESSPMKTQTAPVRRI